MERIEGPEQGLQPVTFKRVCSVEVRFDDCWPDLGVEAGDDTEVVAGTSHGPP